MDLLNFILFVLALLAISESCVAGDNNTCNSLKSLASALTSNDDNMQNLTQVFYPPRQPSAKIVKVIYYFEDEMGKHDDCNVTYFWASGAFLLIQPPSIFQFTSLFFNHKVAGEETTLILTLPNACRHLVLHNTTCSCDQSNEGVLDLLTHQVCFLYTFFTLIIAIFCTQLKLYAKYMTIGEVEQDDSVFSVAICDDEVDSTYYLLDKTHYQVYLFLIVLLILPTISIALTATVVRSLHRRIHASIVRRSGHHNMTGIVLTGTFITFFIVGCDMVAVYSAYHGDYIIFQDHKLKNTLNFISTAILLAYDLLVALYPITVLLLLCCKHIQEYAHRTDESKKAGHCRCSCCKNSCSRKCSKCCTTCFLPQCLILAFYAIFGKLQEQDPVWEETKEIKKITNSRVLWIITLLLVAPYFVISSHIGFILISWLTDSAQASSVALICLAVILYLFIMLSKCYSANEQVNPKGCFWSTCILFYAYYQALKYIGAFCAFVTKHARLAQTLLKMLLMHTLQMS